MTDPQPPQPAPPTQLRLGIWGPPASGKTTYLAALNIAALRSRLPGNWIMNGIDPASSRFLRESTELLTGRRTFPVATDSPQNMMFRFTGERRIEKKNWRGQVSVTVEREAFELDVLDVPGGDYRVAMQSDPDREVYAESELDLPDFRPELSGEPPENTDLLDHLQWCKGIVYLFDPERDNRQGDAFNFFHGMLEQLAGRILQGDYAGARLPHRVAVCITKFDQPSVYRSAFKRGYAVQDAHSPNFPKVEDHRAHGFFQELCRDDNTNADLVASALRKYFDEDRVRYFVTSSIGFHTINGRFQMQDYNNVERIGNGDFRIRGKVRPINVLEPLIWLYDSAKGAP
jgi:hypothetical protein